MNEASPHFPTFAELGVAADLVAALAARGIVVPTPIQAQALTLLHDGRDAYLLAGTGTGKTLAYLLPLVARLDLEQAATQAVVVAPTHELAIQIQRECMRLAQDSGRAVRTLLLIGGTSVDRQLEKLKKKPHVVVGSPGRIAELIAMRKLKTSALRTVVVDEADRLLSRESLPGVRAILDAAPRERQLVCASATEQPDVRAALAGLAPELTWVVADDAAAREDVEHLYVVCEARDRPDVLRRLLGALRPERAIVFAHRSETADEVAAKLAHHGVPAAELHAASDKRDRQRAMDDFRSGRVSVLVATDVAARGLDVAGVTHVFNLDVPTQAKAYLHRVGRTGRAGQKGVAVTLMTANEVRRVSRYESELGVTLTRVRLREGRLAADEGDR